VLVDTRTGGTPVHVRRSLLAAAAALLVLTTAGCGGDDKKSDDVKTTETTAKAAGSDTTAVASDDTTPETLIPTTTISDSEYQKMVEEFNDQIEAAGDDFCKLAEAPDALLLETPSTPDQTKAMYESFATALTTIADHLPAGSTADPAILKDAAKRIIAEGEAAQWNPSQLMGTPEVLSDPAVMPTMAAVSEDIQKNCGTDGGEG